MSFFYLMFRVTSSVLHLEPCFQFGVQSHDFSMTFGVASPIWRSKPHLLFGIQSHYLLLTFRAFIFFSLAFRVVSSFWHSEPLFSLAFSATIFFWFQRLESLCILIQVFRVTIFPHFDVQSHFSSALSFRVIAFNIHIHWHYKSCLHDFAFVLIFLTLLPCTYHFFTMFFYTSPSTAHDLVF